MPNRLAAESSLYLRQHANNPVDWFPWGPEALARAAAEDRPIFLSVGYSACHWCHVMEHESFEDDATAAVMNQHFVCVKVDREERPDLDQIYMTALQLLTREGGGWPLSVFLAPDRTPFYAGTYFPPADKYGRPSFRRLLAAIADAWKTRRGELLEVGSQVTAALNGMGEREAGDGDLTESLVRNAARALRRTADTTHGGFGHAPKFPHAIDLKLLLRTARRFNSDDGEIVRLTLEKMARGGLYDQAGGGFHRYSVDAVWLVPHFEKMLYDNALLPPVYVEAYQLTRDPFYRQIACETLDWATAEMTAPGGGFYSTLDADSEGEEGKFYVWSEAESDAVLGADAEFARQVFGTSAGGNFEGHNILCRARPDAADAKRLGISDAAFAETIARVKRTLYDHRVKRIWPGRDEKLLTAWNGLMIAAFAQAGAVFAEPKYVAAASRAADFVLANLQDADGRLYRTCGDTTPAKLSGYLEDYAYLADGLVALYEATGDVRRLQSASELCDVMLAHFRDPAGGFYYTADDHEALIARTRDLHDGSTPSGNAMATLVLLKLAALCDRADYRAAALATMAVYRTQMADSPAAAATMLLALDFHLGPPTEVAVVGPPGPDFDRAKAAVFARFDPHRVVATHDPTTPPPEVAVLRGKAAVDGRVTAYICRNYACAAPLVGADSIVAAFAP